MSYGTLEADLNVYHSECAAADVQTDEEYSEYYDNVESEYQKFLKTKMSYTDTMNFIAGLTLLKTYELSRSDACEVRFNVLAKYPQAHIRIAEYFMGESF